MSETTENKKISAYDVMLPVAELIAQLIESGGELTPDIEKLFDDYEQNTEEVLRRYRYRMSVIDNRVKHLKAEAKRLTEAAGSMNRGQLKLKQRAMQLLLEHETLKGESKVTYEGGCAFLRRTKGLEVDDESEFIAAHSDSGFVAHTPKIDKAATKAALASGQEVEGAKLVEVTSITLK